jgi:hypothetical protein
MVLLDPFSPGVRHTLVAGLLRRAEEAFDRCRQTGLVVFNHQRVVGALLDDLGSDRLLAAHGVDGDDTALQQQGVQQFRDGRDFV